MNLILIISALPLWIFTFLYILKKYLNIDIYLDKNDYDRENYRPLPNCLTVKKSSIDGLGLYSTEDICQYKVLGKTHVMHKGELIRTPLGGFINHSDEPNCHKVLLNNEDYYLLVSTTPIKKNQELTLKYTLVDEPKLRQPVK